MICSNDIVIKYQVGVFYNNLVEAIKIDFEFACEEGTCIGSECGN